MSDTGIRLRSSMPMVLTLSLHNKRLIGDLVESAFYKLKSSVFKTICLFLVIADFLLQMSSSKKPHSNKLALTPSSQPTIPTPSLELVNRYQVLGTIPKPTYTSVLATSPPQMNPFQSTSSRSDYLLKPHTTNLFLS